MELNNDSPPTDSPSDLEIAGYVPKACIPVIRPHRWSVWDATVIPGATPGRSIGLIVQIRKCRRCLQIERRVLR